jgi:predicted metal-binding membrane protein
MRTSRPSTGATTASSVEGPGVAERLLIRDRWITGAALTVTALLCWAWIVPMSRDMYGDMSGASAWMMRDTWDAPHLALLFAMWFTMMAGMMLPSAAPVVLLYAMVVRKDAAGGSPLARVHVFLAGYLLCWGAFSAAATALQRLLAHLLWLSPMMEPASRWFAAATLIAAGLYQFTPLKRSCLTQCRAPAVFISRNWRPGIQGALRMGMLHGLECVGCCWVLMLLLFAGGVMRLMCIAALTALVLVEKLAPWGERSAQIIGAALIAAGAVAPFIG